MEGIESDVELLLESSYPSSVKLTRCVVDGGRIAVRADRPETSIPEALFSPAPSLPVAGTAATPTAPNPVNSGNGHDGTNHDSHGNGKGQLPPHTLVHAAVEVTDCVFSNGVSGTHGGGLQILTRHRTRLALANTRFTNCSAAAGDGGAVHAASVGAEVSLSNCSFARNSARSGTGGGVSVQFAGSVIITACSFSHDLALGLGGSVALSSVSAVFVQRSLFNGSYAGAAGGALSLQQTSAAVVSDSVFEAARAGVRGGAIAVTSGSFRATSTAFRACSAGAAGGALSIVTAVVFANLTNVTLSSCESHRGAGLSFLGRSLVMDRSRLLGCTASGEGGGIFAEAHGGSIAITETSAEDNTALSGSAMFLHAAANVTVNRVWFVRNRSPSNAGGALVVSHAASGANVTLCMFDGNVAHGGTGLMLIASPGSHVGNSTFRNNTAEVSGAGLYIKGSDRVMVAGCLFELGSATDGSGLFLESGEVLVEDTTFASNNATAAGTVTVFTGAAVVTACDFTNNTADRGGAVHVEKGRLDASGLRVEGNAARLGAGISASMSAGDVVITDSFLYGNNASEQGGAVHVLSPYLFLELCTVAGNEADQGAGVYTDAAAVHILSCGFANNTARASGGALFAIDSPWESNITDTLFSNNTAADYGGAVTIGGSGNFSLCTFANNSALPSGSGGAVYLFHAGGDDSMDSAGSASFWNLGGDRPRSTFKEDRRGPAFADCLFSHNQARHGGAVFVRSGKSEFSESSFVGNGATEFGPNFAAEQGEYSLEGPAADPVAVLPFEMPWGNLTDCRGADPTYCGVSMFLYWSYSGNDRDNLMRPPPDPFAEEEEDYYY